ncbi:MAG: apolipoprotein N-acyltransferase [bacterium]|nr:MAG: apolipoprotein N-acyltransferase [bacterium]
MKRIHLLLLSLTSGLLLAAAWPEHGFTPLIFVALVPLFFVQQHLGDTGRKGMFWLAWLTFFIWNALTTWWIWNSTAGGAVIAILLNSLFMATVFQAFHISKKWLFNNRRGFGILIFYWISWEYFNMNWDLTWPWLSLGNVFASKHTWIQWYEFTGVLGGSFWVILINILVFNVLQYYRSKEKTRMVGNLTLLFLLLFVPLTISLYRYSHYEETRQPVNVVVVQPNIDPYTEEYGLPPAEILQKNLKLAAEKINDSTNYVIFPESTIQEDIWEDNLRRSQSIRTLQNFIRPYPKLSVVIGAATFRWLHRDEKRTPAARFYRKGLYYYAYNTAFYLDNSPYVQVHHKSKLVPGVEKMPSWFFLKPLEKYAINLGGIVGTLKEDNHTTVFTNEQTGVKIAPLICYESVYGDFVNKTVRAGAGLIVVITNDGWWGPTPGYRQHFLFSVLRAIETRRDVAQSATTGISGFINQRGDVLQKTAYWKPAVIARQLNLNSHLTYYVKHGDMIARISAYISVLILLASVVQGILKKRKSLF